MGRKLTTVRGSNVNNCVQLHTDFNHLFSFFDALSPLFRDKGLCAFVNTIFHSVLGLSTDNGPQCRIRSGLWQAYHQPSETAL